ncbi:MAG: response regulator transcription factor [Hydrogenophilaceae bacterium]|jgi:two-component system OmpR family response regulator|nr:response regulator transcription factor [Hydrogenophilaceae bacterium]
MPPDAPPRVLIVDDDATIREGLAEVFERSGFAAACAPNAAAMDKILAERGADLVILDLMMPGEDGLSAARRLAGRGWPPVIMLSALGDDADRIVGLEVGADDYMAKPCNPRELVARARAVLRRAREIDPVAARAETMRFAGFRLDLARRELTDPDGVLVSLSTGEFRLLRAFVERPQRVLTREQLLDLAFANDTDVFDRAVDVQVSRLRKKLERAGEGELIRTVRGEGYLFTAKPTPG